MPILTVNLNSEAKTAQIGAALARALRRCDVICLSGPLGAGKTTLARAIIKPLTDAIDVPSPTYTLVEIYEARDFSLWHFDLYRLEKPSDIWELGLEEAFENGAAIIEWPERAAALLPQTALHLSIALRGKMRVLSAKGDKAWATRLAVAGIE